MDNPSYGETLKILLFLDRCFAENLNIGRSAVDLVEGDIAVDNSRGSSTGKLWPNGVLVYEIDSSLSSKSTY